MSNITNIFDMLNGFYDIYSQHQRQNLVWNYIYFISLSDSSVSAERMTNVAVPRPLAVIPSNAPHNALPQGTDGSTSKHLTILLKSFQIRW